MEVTCFISIGAMNIECTLSTKFVMSVHSKFIASHQLKVQKTGRLISLT